MSTKAQHNRHYRKVPLLLKQLREEAGLTQRQLADALKKPQSWVFKSESSIRRVDVAEFVDWAEVCRVHPVEAMQRLLEP